MTAAPRILVITPVRHIDGVSAVLEGIGEVRYLEAPTLQQVVSAVGEYDAIFTNPNKSNVFLGRDVIEAGRRLSAICTASTGLAHIDVAFARERGVAVLSLTEERAVIDSISSTAEHAFALMLAAVRRIPQAFDHVRQGGWDYTPFIGRQLDHLTAGIVGYGRLGSKFGRYAAAFFRRVLAYDPYVPGRRDGVEACDLETLLRESDVISVHVHLTAETRGMIGPAWFARMKPGVVLVNTARGEVFDEPALIEFLHTHPDARLAADVIANEIDGKQSSPLIEYARRAPVVILTPHIGGMTVEGQRMAYTHAASMLARHFAGRRVPRVPALS